MEIKCGGRGVTRVVILISRYAIKLPRRYDFFDVPSRFRLWWVRGWLANRSEWKQRRRGNVNPPLFTLGYLISIYRRADSIPAYGWWDHLVYGQLVEILGWEEAKADSWGLFGDEYKLIDYDKADEHPRGIVGDIYYGRQERWFKRWLDDGN